MFQDPAINEAIFLDRKYHFTETPHAPGVVYAEVGRKAKVYRVINGGNAYALKAFKPKYRSREIVENTRRIADFAEVPGLSVAHRLVITPEGYPDAIDDYPDFTYAVIMPWVEGKSWFNYLSGKVALRKHESMRLARQLINTIFELEKRELAHCDLSSSNFVFSADFGHVELIDIEDMFGYGLLPPKGKPKGTSGYTPSWLKSDGAWEAGADRFSTSILVSEILGWQFEEIRETSSGDTYFADGEFGHKSKRFRLLSEHLEQFHPELSRLFKTTWYAESLEECPRISDWKRVLDTIREPIMEISPDFLQFGILDLSTKPPIFPKTKIKVKNVGEGVLHGNITPNVPWIRVSPKEFTCSEKEISEHTITLTSNVPTEKKRVHYTFNKGIVAQGADITKGLDGEYSIQHSKIFIPNWTIIAGVIIILIIGILSKPFPAFISPAITPTIEKPTNTLTPTKTPSKIPTPKPTKTSTPTITPVPQSKLLFQEDFEDNQIGDEWSTVWEIDTDDQENHFWVATGTYHAYPHAWLSRDNKENWVDYALETKVYIVSGGLFLNIRDSGEDSSQRYTAWLGEKDDWVSMAQYTFPPSNFAEISGAGTNFKIDVNKWYTLRVEIIDTYLAFYIDNKLISKVDIPAPVVSTYGSIGFYVTSGDEVYLDDIRVWSLSEREISLAPIEPAASLLSNNLIRPCEWDVRVNLAGFKPNSVITVSSNYSEIVCSDGSKVTSSWTVDYPQKTDTRGNLVTSYLHRGTGDYNYSYVDEKGNSASLSFTTDP
jgi:serine/threonine protein kinase